MNAHSYYPFLRFTGDRRLRRKKLTEAVLIGLEIMEYQRQCA